MSWLFSRVLVEEYLGDISSDGEPSVQSSGNPTQLAYCAPDKMTGFSRLSRFGMTYKPLTADRGEELLTLYRAASPVRTSAPQEREQELMESEAECGEKWHGSFAKYDPDSFLWKTHQCSLLGDLELFSETWPRWGLMQNGECYQRRKLVHPIAESVFGWLLPTPVASDATSGAVIGKNDTYYTTSTGMPRKVNQQGTDGSVGLARLVQMWPTPVALMGGMYYEDNWEDRKSSSLATAVLIWPTPRTKGMCGGSGSWKLLKKNTTIEEARQMGARNGGQLNPTWVEWLMGWPLGWTDLKPLETDKYQKWLDAHGKS